MAVNRRARSPNASPSRGSDARKMGVKNELLLKLPRPEFQTVFSKMQLFDFPPRAVLAEQGKPIESCYFLNQGVASIIHVMTGGRSIEVGLTGREGFIGIPSLVGYPTSPTRAVIQIAASGYRIRLEHFKTALPRCPSLQKLLSRYSQDLSLQSIQIAACNRLHSVDQQLARWLLMTQDRVDQTTFPLTQEFISHMLGTRRASVSVAAGILQKSGIIQYSRGQVTILDRLRLENASCECYREINKQLASWKKI